MVDIITESKKIEVPYCQFFENDEYLEFLKDSKAIVKGFLKQKNYYLKYYNDEYYMTSILENLEDYEAIQEKFEDHKQLKCQVDFYYGDKKNLELNEQGNEYLGVLFQDGSYYVSKEALSHRPAMLAYLNECIIKNPLIESAYQVYQLNKEHYYYSCEEDFLIKYLGVIKFGSIVDGKYFIYISNPELESKEQLQFLEQQEKELYKQAILPNDYLDLLKSKQLIKEIKK